MTALRTIPYAILACLFVLATGLVFTLTAIAFGLIAFGIYTAIGQLAGFFAAVDDIQGDLP